MLNEIKVQQFTDYNLGLDKLVQEINEGEDIFFKRYLKENG